MDSTQRGGAPRGPLDAEPEAVQRLAEDWSTIVRSEWAAIATDPETGLVLRVLFASWLSAFRAFDAAQSEHLTRSGGVSRPDAPPRPEAAAAAAEPRGDGLEALRARLDELERRLDRLGRVAGGSGEPRGGG